MTRKTIFTLALAPVLAVALVAGAAQARGPGEARGGPGGMMGQMMPDFATLDSDGDGKVTKAELDARRVERQKAMDPDGDGFITLDEMKAHAAAQARERAEAMVDRMFAGLDTDKDGKLSAAEALAGPMAGARGADRLFDRVDRDGDGAISQLEYDRMAERMQGRGEGRRGGGMRGEGKHGEGMRGHGKPWN